jgi:hypothetical protein
LSEFVTLSNVLFRDKSAEIHLGSFGTFVIVVGAVLAILVVFVVSDCPVPV